MSIVSFDTQLPEYAAPCERPVIQKAVDLCLWDSGTVSIWDGEELSVQRSTDRMEILNNLAQTEMDQLEAYDKDGKFRGWFLLIYNNGSEQEPMIVISDYSVNDWTENVYRKLDESFGERWVEL